MMMLNVRWWRRGSWPRETSHHSSHSSTPASRLWCVVRVIFNAYFLLLRNKNLYLTGCHFAPSSLFHQAFCSSVCVCVCLPSYLPSHLYLPYIYLQSAEKIRYWAETTPEYEVSGMTSALCVDRVTQGVFNKATFTDQRLIIQEPSHYAGRIDHVRHFNISGGRACVTDKWL